MIIETTTASSVRVPILINTDKVTYISGDEAINKTWVHFEGAALRVNMSILDWKDLLREVKQIIP